MRSEIEAKSRPQATTFRLASEPSTSRFGGEYAYSMGISASDEPRAKQTAFRRGSEALIA